MPDHTTSLLTGLSFVFLCVPATADDWSRYRGPDGTGVADGTDFPELWSDTDNLSWKCPLPGHGASSPIVIGNTVYVTAFTGYGLDPDDPGQPDELRLHVIAVERHRGAILWDRAVHASPNEQPATRRIADHGYASATAVGDSDGVFAYFGVSGLVAFDHKGRQRWHVMTGTQTAGFGSAASPILHGDHVIINASIECGAVIAFDRTTGREAWRIPNVEKSWTTPLVATTSRGAQELVVSQKNIVRGFDPVTGDPLWSCEGVLDYVVPCVVQHEGVIYVLGGRKNQSMAIRLGGRGEVTDTHRLWSSNVGANVTSPVYDQGHLYWASDRGVACCLNARTGETVYQERLKTRERVYASTILAGNHLLVTTRENGFFLLHRGPEYREVAHNRFAADDSLNNATPAAADGRLYHRTNRFLYCVAATPEPAE